MMEKRVETVLLDASTGPFVAIGQKVKKGEIVGYTPDGSAAFSPVTGTVLACQFDADKHLLCLFIEAEPSPG